jgi:hypothetical protein
MTSPAPFLVLSLPRSRSAWMAKFLTYGDYVCGHDELRHMRSLDDVRAWFTQPCIGSAETAAAPWWRLLEKFAPGVKIVVVRRPVAEVVDSLMRLDGVTFDRTTLTAAMIKADRKLEQIEACVPGVLSVQFADLVSVDACQAVFKHCLPYKFSFLHWAALSSINIQCDLRAMVRYVDANRPAFAKLTAIAKHATLAAMSAKPAADPDGITFQLENFEQWLRDARPILEDHIAFIGDAPDSWTIKNLDLMRRFDDQGAMHIMTARSNGRMFGYLMTLTGPSLATEGIACSTHGTFYADPTMPGLGMKLQRAAVASLRSRGVDHIFMQAGNRGTGPRLGAMYRRLGAVSDGEVFRLQLAGA